MANQQQTRTIRVIVDSKGASGLKEIAGQMAGLNKSVKSVSSSFSFLNGTLASVAGFFGIRQLVSYSDEMQNLTNRIKLFTGSQEAANAVLRDLQGVAGRTNSTIDSVAETYARLAGTLTRTKLTSAEIVDITELLQNTFRVSGSTIAETTGVIVQLSQAFASGQLRGQELRSVMEGNAFIARKLNEAFGKDIYKKAEQGALSASTVFKILYDNAEELNTAAAKLAPTIGSTLANALGELKLAINDLNQDSDFAGSFNTLVRSVIADIKNLGLWLTYLKSKLIDAIGAYKEFQASTANGAYSGRTDADVERIERLKLEAKGLREEANSLRESLDKPADIKGMVDRKAALDKVDKALGGATGKAKKIKEVLAELNKSYLKGSIDVKTYNDNLVDFQFYKVNREFKEGKLNLNQLNLALEELSRQNINRLFTQGRISVEEFNQAISDSSIRDLNTKLQSGLISLKEYRIELAKVSEEFNVGVAFSAGTQSYLDSLGTTTQQVAQMIEKTFSALEDNFLSFIKTGKFNFADFTQAILDDLLKIIVRASIIKPIADGLLNANFGTAAMRGTSVNGGGSGQTISASPFAKGGVFGSGINAFASGGVVNSPTMFGYGSGKTGLMGEAGPEAILPLSRGPGGSLGVQASVTPVTVIVNNNASGTDTEQRESTGPNGEKQIEILVFNKVREGLSNGAFDKPMKTAYGLSRKGQ